MCLVSYVFKDEQQGNGALTPKRDLCYSDEGKTGMITVRGSPVLKGEIMNKEKNRVLDPTIKPFYYFEEISKIPHGSYNERAIADYVEKNAKSLGLRYVRDENNVVIVYVPASAGFEDHPPVMLQGHMDMVCEKNAGCGHDFEKDPLELYIENGFLHARGTTLGADDGCGVSFMLSLINEKEFMHPPLECVFTTAEEVGMDGANGLDASLITARRMIGLDIGVEGCTYVTSAGGSTVKVTFPDSDAGIADESVPCYSLVISGLLGGHSGSDINKCRANANKAAARVMHEMNRLGARIRLMEMTGGAKYNAIPRDCEVLFASQMPEEVLLKIAADIEHAIKAEKGSGDPGIKISLEHTGKTGECRSESGSRAVIEFMFLSPNGFIEKSVDMSGLTTVSLNMGVVRLDKENCEITYLIRSPFDSARDELIQKLEDLSGLLGGKCELCGDYGGWAYDPDSQMRSRLKSFYKECTGAELKEVGTHGGLETGLFIRKIPGLDIVTLGPEMHDYHSPSERLNLESFRRTYELLKGFLGTL